MLLTLSALVTPSLAVDCTGLDPITCGALDAMEASIEGQLGANLIDAGLTRFASSSIYDALQTAREDAETAGCTVDGSWMAGVYSRGSWTGSWSDTLTTRASSGSFDLGDHRFWGTYETGAGSALLGRDWSTFESSGHLAGDTDDGHAVGVWIRRTGSTGVYLTLRATCPDDGTAWSSLDAWVDADLEAQCTLSDRYTDVDGDGQGSAAAAFGCLGGSYVAAGGDCDDTDPTVYGGALERCDGQQNDCDTPWTDDDGLVTFSGDDSTVTDMSATFAAGTSAAPASIALAAPGTLAVCDGTYYVGLSVTADLTIVGTGSDRVSLDGAGSVRNIHVNGADAITVQGLQLANGATTGHGGAMLAVGMDSLVLEDLDVLGADSGNVGGAMFLKTIDTVRLDNVRYRGCHATVQAGALYTENFELAATDVEFEGNATDGSAGAWQIGDDVATVEGLVMAGNVATGGSGGLSVTSRGVLTVDGALFEGNVASAGGAMTCWTDTECILRNVQVLGNSASGNGGGLRAAGSTLTVESSTITGNTAGSGSGVFVNSSATGTFVDVDLTEQDILVGSGTYAGSASTTVVCTGATDSCE